MKIEKEGGLQNLFFSYLKKVRDVVAAVFLFLGYHWYDAFCYTVSNSFSFRYAFFIMLMILFLFSISFVYFHDFLKKRYAWDAMGLDHLSKLLLEDEIPKSRFLKRLTRSIMVRGYWWIYFIGPLIIGPPIVTVILRRKKSLKQNLLYVIPGTFFSVVFWVLIWSWIGLFTWDQLVIPFFKKLI